MPKLGIVADDLTGCTTIGALLARVGVDTAVLFSPTDVSALTSDHEALILNSDSRPLPAADAYERVRLATQELVAAGARQFTKRIDTTCRGGIGPEVEGMLSALPEDYIAIMVPAMPQSKRIVVGGYSVIDSVLLSRTPVAQDVRTPVKQSHLPTLMASQCTVPVGHVPIGAVIDGAEEIRAGLVSCREAGDRVIVVDAASLEDVDLIATVVAGLGWKVVCVDPGPFTERLAIRSGVVDTRPVKERTLRLEPADTDTGTALVVAGSAMRVTHLQMVELSKVPGTEVIGVDVGDLIADERHYLRETGRVLDEVERILPKQPRVIMLALDSTISGDLGDMAAMERRAGLQPGEGPGQIPGRFGALARRVVEALGDSVAGLYLTGGDIMVNTCAALDANGIGLVDYVIPQADQGVLVGGPWAGLPVICKGGLTGSEQTAIQCVNRIFDEKME
ncbi:four-carbon acid sugar kinase family protein [Micropruina sp.]|uniref:four-carbon acid sugar kinase family protein n=1 Tax=Micropruina sp. TaxID=2737536 RepID=UPI00261AC5EC|nr:four-carbon acid sugar kinase family protein [Micropruina sp.]